MFFLLIPWSLGYVLLCLFNSLYLKVYFVWYKYSGFLLISKCVEYLFHPFTFSLCVHLSLDLKWVSCRWYIYSSQFCIHSATIYILIRTFSSLLFLWQIYWAPLYGSHCACLVGIQRWTRALSPCFPKLPWQWGDRQGTSIYTNPCSKSAFCSTGSSRWWV